MRQTCIDFALVRERTQPCTFKGCGGKAYGGKSYARKAYGHKAYGCKAYGCILALALAVSLSLWQLPSPATAQDTTAWKYFEEERPGETPGLFAQIWANNHITKSRSLAFFKCDLDPKVGGLIYFAFVPSRLFSLDPEETEGGLASLYWRVDNRAGVPVPMELSLLQEGRRIQYKGSGQAVVQMLQGMAERGRKKLYLVDSRIPDGGVLDVFTLNGARPALLRVLKGCSEFEATDKVVFPNLGNENFDLDGGLEDGLGGNRLGE